MAVKKTIKTEKNSFGLEQNLASALCYSVGWVTGLLFLLSEKKNQVIRFHAMQSIIVFGFFNLVFLIPVIGWILSPLVAILTFVLWLVLMLKAYQGEKFSLPIAGEIAEKQLKKIKI